MSRLKKAHTAQSPLYAEFSWSTDDTMVSTQGTVNGFMEKKTFDAIKLPVGAVILSGEVRRNQKPGYIAWLDSGEQPEFDAEKLDDIVYKIKVGDGNVSDRYMAETDVASATASLVPTGYVNDEALTLQITVTDFTYDDEDGEEPLGTFTPGETGEFIPGLFTLRVKYVVEDRVTEVN